MSDDKYLNRFFTLYPDWDFSKPEEDQKPFHWYASSFANWQTGDDLFGVLKELHGADKRCGYHPPSANVFMVPLASDVKYKIRNYEPDVEGLVYIGKVTWPEAKKKKGQKS